VVASMGRAQSGIARVTDSRSGRKKSIQFRFGHPRCRSMKPFNGEHGPEEGKPVQKIGVYPADIRACAASGAQRASFCSIPSPVGTYCALMRMPGIPPRIWTGSLQEPVCGGHEAVPEKRALVP